MPETKTRSKGPSMVVIAEKLDTLSTTVSGISETVTEIRDKQLTNDVHMKAVIGPPSLEDRMRGYVDEKISHKENNSQQQLLQVQTILQLEQQNAQLKLEAKISAVELASANTEKERQNNHNENSGRLNKLERNMYFAMGGLAVIDVVLRIVWK